MGGGKVMFQKHENVDMNDGNFQSISSIGLPLLKLRKHLESSPLGFLH